jgi:hypothetical protein
MKNLMVANLKGNSKRYDVKSLTKLLKAQIENSLDVGWKKKDIVIIANFDFEYMGVRTVQTDLNDFCWTGSKVFAVKWYYENTDYKGVIWSHDLDAWQNVPFLKPKFKHVGISQYSKPKYNGGSVFWRHQGKDILDEVVRLLTDNQEVREEPTLNRVLKSKQFRRRVTLLNNTFNVGCSGFVKRYEASIKPICVCHFHPYNRIAWETHTMDRNQIGDDKIPVSRRLERLIRKYYTDLPIKLKGDHKCQKKTKK